jgi:mannosyl-oligosaccharide alpha-1,2-mannosidase
MYLKTMDTVRKYLLYRPMVPGNRNILFSGKVTTAGNPDIDLAFDPEVTHLTCFLGGMVGMGAKLFGLDADLEIAEKLSDGCVWAYESMKSGIMPEAASVVACESVTDCPWNETRWHEVLDPFANQRDQLFMNYESNKAKLEALQEASRLAEESKLAAEAAEAVETDIDANLESPVPANSDGAPRKEDSTPSLRKRDIHKENQNPTTRDLSGNHNSPKSEPPKSSFEQDRFQKKLKDTEDELVLAAPGREVKNPPLKEPQLFTPTESIDPDRPLTHEEYVKGRLESEGIPPGFVDIGFPKYILR